MSSTYKGILTNNGKALIAQATTSNQVGFSHIAIGDGNGSVPTPSDTRTALVRERHRLTLNSVDINPNNRNQIICETIIPSNVGGWTIRELGLYAGSTMVVHSNYPATYKPLQNEGGARELVIRMIINVQSADVIALTLNDSLIYATREWVETNFINHNEVINNLTSTDINKPLSANQGKILNENKVQKTTTITAGNGLTGGGDLSANRSLVLGTPSTINATSTNSVTATSHSHAIDKASTTSAGIVQLNDTLTSTATNQALTANQGKILNDNKVQKTTTITAGNGLTGGGDLSANRSLALGTPSTITATSTNSVTATSHSHAIDRASTTVAGIVQLNDTLTSTSTTQALTANQGKFLNNLLDELKSKTTWQTLRTVQDLNNIKSEGYYFIQTHQNLNVPEELFSKWLFVTVEGSVATRLIQTVVGDTDTKTIYKRLFLGTHWTTWQKIAYIDSNVASASKLQTPRTINGVAFDGTQNISLEAPLTYRGNANTAEQLDNAKETGFYLVNNNPTITAMGLYNYGILYVYKQGNVVHQLYYAHVPNYKGSSATRVTWHNDWARSANWRIIDAPLNNTLTSTATNQALTAHQGKILNESKVEKATKPAGTDVKTLKQDGIYALTNGGVNLPTTSGAYKVLSMAGNHSAWVHQFAIKAYSTEIWLSSQRSSDSEDWLAWKRLDDADWEEIRNKPSNIALLTDNIASATKLQTARTINGVAFDGTQNITITDDTKTPKTTTITAGNGLTGGGDLSTNRSLALGTPSTINATSTNSVTATSHSHAIDKASTTGAGIVQLNDTLTSTATNQALTANQGKILQDSKLGKNDNAATATKLQTTRQIALTGAVTGSVNFDGSSNVSINTQPNTSNLRVISGTGYTITYDDHRRIAIIEMTLWENKPVYNTAILTTIRNNETIYYGEFTLPITLKKRLNTDIYLTETTGYTFSEEAMEWLAFIHPVGYNNTTESKFGVSFRRWSGTTNEPVNAKAMIVGIF